MLETIREYAIERLKEAGEHEQVQRAFASFVHHLVADADDALRGSDQSMWRRRLDAERDNIRGALTWCLTEGADPDMGARIAIRLGHYWYSRGLAVEGIEWLEQARRSVSGLGDDLRAQLVQRLGILYDQRSDAARAAPLFEEAAALFRSIGDEKGTAGALNSLGSSMRSLGDVERARALWDESLALRRALGDQGGAAAVLCNLGILALDAGDPARASGFFEEARALDAELGDDWAVAIDEAGLGEAALDVGDLGGAALLLRKTLDSFGEMGEEDRLAEALGRVAGLAAARGDHVRSARLAGAAEALWDAIGIPLPPPDRARFEHFQEKARAALDAETYGQAWAEGRSMTKDQAVIYAAGGIS